MLPQPCRLTLQQSKLRCNCQLLRDHSTKIYTALPENNCAFGDLNHVIFFSQRFGSHLHPSVGKTGSKNRWEILQRSYAKDTTAEVKWAKLSHKVMNYTVQEHRATGQKTDAWYKSKISKLRAAGQIRPAKPFHRARGDILSIKKNKIFMKILLIW